jgi:hypothetical protein
MATINAMIRWADNTDELKRNLAEGLDQVEALRAGADRMVKSLGGEKLLQSANNLTAAVDKIGGAAKLTEAEQARVNATLTKAIDKYEALGKTAPPAMLALQKATEQHPSLLNRITTALGPLGTAMAAAFSVTAVIAAGKKVIDFASHLTDLSQKTGISTTGLQKLDLAFEQNGISLDTVTTATTKLAKNLVDGDKSAVGALTKLGLSVGELKQMAPEDQFVKVADAVGRIQNPTEKAYAAMAIFGKGGAELLAGLDGHLKETTDKFEAMGLIIDEKTIKAADDFGDQLGLMGKQLLGIVATVVGPLLPALSGLGSVLMWLGQNVIGPVFTYSIKAALTVIEMFWAGLATLLAHLADLAQKIPIVGSHLGALTKASDWLKDSAALTTKHVDSLWRATDTVGQSAKKATPHLIGLGELPDGPLKSLLHNLEEMVTKLTPLPGHFVLVSTQVHTFGDEAAKLVQQADAMGVKVPEAVRKIAAAWNAAEINKLMNTATAKWLKDLDEFAQKGGEKLEAAAKNMADAIIKNDDLMRTSRRDTSQLVQQYALSDFEFQIAQLLRWREEQKKAVDRHAANSRETFAAIDDDFAAKMALMVRTHNDALAEMEAKEHSWRNILIGTFADIPNLLKSAFTGGGGLSGALSALVSGLGGNIGGKLFEAGGALNGIGNTLTGGMSKIFGSSIGTAFGLALPGIGSAVGALAPVILSGFKKLFGFGPSELDKTHKALNDFINGAGGLATLQQKAAEAGLSLNALYAARDQKALKSAIDAFNQGLERHKQLLADIATGIDGVLSAAQGLGGSVPSALKPMIESLLQSKNLTEEQRKALSDLANRGPDYDKLTEAAKKYGLSLADLGPKFQQAALDKLSFEYADDFRQLVDAGANADNVIKGMAPKIQKLIDTSVEFGGTVPESMRPLLQKMVDLGLLVDTNGKKFDDLSSFNFNDSKSPLDIATDKLVKAIEHLGEILAGLPGVAQNAAGGIAGALNSIPSEKHVTVYIDEVGRGTDYAARGGLVTGSGIQYLGGGGTVLPFVPRGSDVVPAMLTPGEGVVNTTGMGILGRGGLRALNSGGQVVDMSEIKAMRKAVERLEARMTDDSRRQAERLGLALSNALIRAKASGGR